MNISLKGKTALVCGASQGIGLAAAQELALLGASCILVSRNAQQLKQALHTLATTEGQQHIYMAADLGLEDEVKTLVITLQSALPIHILVNNSGGPKGGPILDAQPEAFTQGFAQHVLSSQLLAQALVPGMKSAGYGRIIQIISTSVKTPLKNLGVSNTIRAAVANWAKTLAGELAPFGITVNNILPGSTKTARLESIFNTTSQQRGVDKSVIEREWLAEIPAGRFGEAHEIAAAVAFLATPAAAYITGINVPVDGGRTPSL
ncbi:3-oxoacyl-[acyl-carrier protein] reductase [Chitinophaga costaii]|uniref:3-oxoacyl-[acyl-carrier protein] reductase n=1 Tax=Chitinophaga costaii TaxID=1335309 RepID=A0A1C4FPX1_9BACT|nr:SDR family oxidoreductase [Chitinophaga costaii]PUZ20448.1 KR domain-containing protein [Chitinophaga costaii]SCC58010.1 3-oxoacyl-[acyl-carrier protein] reductase [Chitinophaga costaii]